MISLKEFHESNKSSGPISPSGETVEIEILLAGIVFGPYTEAKIRERLTEGLLTTADQARFAASETWVTVDEVLSRIPAPSAPPPARAPAQEASSSGFLTGPIPHFRSTISEVAVIPAPEPEETLAEAVSAPELPVTSQEENRAIPAQPREHAPPRFKAAPLTAPSDLAAETSAPEPPLTPMRARTRAILPPSAPGNAQTRTGGIRSKILAHTSREPLRLAPDADHQMTTTQQKAFRSRTRALPFYPRPPELGGSAPRPPAEASTASAESSNSAASVPRASKPQRASLLGPESPLSARPKQIARPRGLPGVAVPPPALLPETAPAKEPAVAATPPALPTLPEKAVAEEQEVDPIRKPILQLPRKESFSFAPAALAKAVGQEETIKKPETTSLSLADLATRPLPSRDSEEPGPKHSDSKSPISTLPSFPSSVPPAERIDFPELKTAALAALTPPTVEKSSAPASKLVFAPPSELADPLPEPKAVPLLAAIPVEPIEQGPTTPLNSVMATRLPARKSQKLQPAPFVSLNRRQVKSESPLGTPPVLVPKIRETTGSGPLPNPPTTRDSALPGPVLSLTPPAGQNPVVPPHLSGSNPALTEPLAAGSVAKLASLAAPHAASPATAPNPSLAATTIHLKPPSERPPVSTAPKEPMPPPPTARKEVLPAKAAAPVNPATGVTMKEPSPPETSPAKRIGTKKARMRRQRQLLIWTAAAFAALLVLGVAAYLTLHLRHATKVASVAPVNSPASSSNPAVAMATKPPASPTLAAPVIAPVTPQNDPRVAEHFSQGMTDQANGNLDGAISEFTQSVEINPKFAQGYSYRATARMGKGDLDGALSDDNELLMLEPDNAGGFCQRGFIKQSKDDPDGAIADYTRAIELDPKSYIAFYNRGLIHEQKNEFDAALADYDQALDLNPQLAGAYYHRGDTKADKNDLEGAIADYTRALEINPKLALAACNRALAEQNTGNLDAAFADYATAIATDPKIATAYYNRGLIKEQRNDLDGSIADSSQALTLDPSNAQAYYNRGVALQAKGALAAAAADLRKFSQIAPKDPYADYAHLYLWVITSEQGHPKEANQELSANLEGNWNAEPGQLPSKIADFLLDKLSEADLLILASSPDEKKDQGQHCEVWYFAGVKKLLKGDKHAALDYFHRCVNTGQKDFCEYILAQAELRHLSLG